MATCTIVVPCYNEAERLDLDAFVRHTMSHEHRFIFVNDGSRDETASVLDDLCSANPDQMSALHLPANVGKAEAVRAGVLQAFASSADFVGYFDADLATPLEAISDLESYLDCHPHVEFLLGARVRLLGREIQRKTIRHGLGRMFATAAAFVLRLPVYDTQCGAKLFRSTPAMRSIFAEPFCTRWLFDVELIARYAGILRVAGGVEVESRIHEFPLAAWRDVDGSKVTPRDFIKAVWQLQQIRATYRLEDRNARVLQVPPSGPVERPRQGLTRETVS